MSMNADILGVAMRNQMLATCNKTVFGAALKTAMMNEINKLDQSSDPVDADAYQTAFFEAMADIIIGYIINNSTMWVACADAIIDHIKDRGEIASLACDETEVPAGQGPHTHAISVVTTDGQQGRIS